MFLLEQIQADAVDPKSDLEALLRKCKVLAARLKSEPLEQWLTWESDGYQEGVVVPDYRVWAAEVRGNFYGSVGDPLRNAPVPAPLIPEDVRDVVTRYRCRQGIAGIEETLAACNSEMLNIPVADLSLLLGDRVYAERVCAQAWIQFESGQLAAVLAAVRNRILDFALELWKREPLAGAPNLNGQGPQVAIVNTIFQTTICAGNTNNGDRALAPAVVESDLDSLTDSLMQAGVTPEEITELITAIEAEPARPTPTSFGPQVSSWIAKMVSRASLGAWEVGLRTAGQILADAIGQYYGNMS